jgi:hypothetical protein
MRTFYKCPNCVLIFSNVLPNKTLEEYHYKLQWKIIKPELWKNQTDALVSYIQTFFSPKRILGFGANAGQMAQELQRHGYQISPLGTMNDEYLKDQ